MTARSRILLLIDADQWPATSLHSLLVHARARGEVSAHAFGAFDRAPLSAWAAHYDQLGVARETVPPGKNKADDALVRHAKRVVGDRGTDAVWVATFDRALMQRIARVGAVELRALRDPEGEALPQPLAWESPALVRAPIPQEVIAQLMAIFESVQRPTGEAHFTDLRTRLPDGPALARRHGRDTLLELCRELPDVVVEEPEAGGAVLLRRAPRA